MGDEFNNNRLKELKILERIRRAVATPALTKYDRDHRAAVVRIIARAALLGIVVLLVYRIVSAQWAQILPMTATSLLLVFVLALARRGFVQPAGGVLTWALLGFIGDMIFVNDGLHDTALLAIPGILVVAGLVLERKHFFFFATVIVVFAGFLGFLETSGAIKSRYSVGTNTIDIFDILTILAVTGITIRILADSYLESLKRTRDAEQRIRENSQRLKESELRYRMLFESANDAILILDGGRFTSCNSTSAQMFGFDSCDDLMGLAPWDLSPKLQPDGQDSQIKATEIIAAVLEGKPQRFIWRHLRKGDVGFDAEVSLNRLQTETEVLVQAIVRDVTDRKMMEDRLKQSEEYYRTLVETSPEAIVMIDTKGYLEFASPRAYDLFGVDRSQPVPGTSILQWVSSEDHAVVLERFREAFTNQVEPYSREYHLVRNDGTTFWAEIATAALNGASGIPTGLLLVCRDVTERRKTERALRESEERFARLSDAAFEGIVISKNGKVLDLNSQFARMLGYELSEMIGLDAKQFIAPGSYDLVMQHMRTGNEEPYEHLALKKDGSIFPVEVRAKMIELEGESVRLTALRDITARKKMEEDLRIVWRSAEQSPASMLITDTAGIIQYVNPQFLESSGFTMDEVIGKKPSILKSGLTPAETYSDLWNTVQNGGIWRGELCNKRKNGEFFWESASISGVKNEDGDITHFVAVKIDITDRKKAEGALRRSEEKFRALIENSSDGIVVLNASLESTYRGPSRKRILGYEENEKADILDVVHPDDGHSLRSVLERLLREPEKPATLEIRVKHKDASWRVIEAVGKNLLTNSAVEGIVVNYRDITDRKKVEQELLESELRYRNLVEQSPDGVYRTTEDGKFIDVNRALVKMLGYADKEELMAIDIEKELYVQPGDRTTAALQLKSEEMAVFRLKKKDGSEVWVEDHGRLVSDEHGVTTHHEGILRDVTSRLKAEEDRKNLQNQLFQAQKTELVGTLAAGLAHDFNNILNIVRGNADLLATRLNDAEKSKFRVENISKAANRGSQLIKQLLTIARRTDIVRQTFAINDLVQEVASLFEDAFPKNITLHIELFPELPALTGDPNQLHQVLVNLGVNAKDAMPTGGTLTIQTSVMSGDVLRKKFPEASSSEYIVLTVRDTGTGMDENTRNRMFDPFFTTKKQDKGTGLGLAVVFGIVSNHHGFINVTSAPGNGSAFQISLPAISDGEKLG